MSIIPLTILSPGARFLPPASAFAVRLLAAEKARGLADQNRESELAPRRLDPKTKRIEVLGIPVPYDYIQTIALDKGRKVIYCNTYPVWQMASFDLKTRRSTYLGIGSLGHRAFCDQDGNVWGSFDDSRRLFKYNPDDGFTKFEARPREGDGVRVALAPRSVKALILESQ